MLKCQFLRFTSAKCRKTLQNSAISWENAISSAENLAVCRKAVPLHPNLVKQYTFDTKKTAKRPRWWCKKPQCLTKIISQIQNPAAKVRKINCFTKFFK